MCCVACIDDAAGRLSIAIGVGWVILLIIPTVTLTSRRLHDADLSAWYSFPGWCVAAFGAFLFLLGAVSIPEGGELIAARASTLWACSTISFAAAILIAGTLAIFPSRGAGERFDASN
ncbi:DUF805 domain-containing protein [Curtobacterium sp. A7_M15]|uniref:DUF805 domain-containing protein n=1 Tax=Curtobacterium sp. A7_M15 TaxID=3065241 RepID=UPI003522CE54